MEQNKTFNRFNIPIEEQKQKQENRNRDHIIDLLTELGLDGPLESVGLTKQKQEHNKIKLKIHHY